MYILQPLLSLVRTPVFSAIAVLSNDFTIRSLYKYTKRFEKSWNMKVLQTKMFARFPWTQITEFVKIISSNMEYSVTFSRYSELVGLPHASIYSVRSYLCFEISRFTFIKNNLNRIMCSWKYKTSIVHTGRCRCRYEFC